MPESDSTQKTPKQTPRRPGKTGALNLKSGNPGNRGGGRKPDEFKAMCCSLASSRDVEQAVLSILADPTHNHFVSALKWATEHGYGRPVESLELSGKSGAPLTVRVVYSRE